MAEGGSITCPHCHRSFELTTAMSAAIEARLRQQVEDDVKRRTAELDAREKVITEKALAAERAKAAVEEQIATRLGAERKKLVDQLKQQAREEASFEVKNLQEQVRDQLVKLEAARQREQAILKKEGDLEERKRLLEVEVAEKVNSQRTAIVAVEAKKARDALGDEIAKALQEKADAEAMLKQRDAKLAEAQKNELALRRERQTLQEEKGRFELEKQRAIDAERAKIREAAGKDADEQARLRIAEKDKTITDLQAKLQDALRKAEQGSQQLQGEVQELELEALLRNKFPLDKIEPVPKGEHGGDVLHHVNGELAQACGTILWESKRTKNWSDGWLPKLREDQRAAKAEVAVIISQALPRGIDAFDLVDGVWVAHPRCTIPVGMAIRQLLLEVASARQATEGQQPRWR